MSRWPYDAPRLDAASPDRDPLAGVGRLLVDGTNLLHAMRRNGPAPGRARRPRSSAGCAAPSRRPTPIELVFDGPPERGLRDERIAPGLTVRYSGARTGRHVSSTDGRRRHRLGGTAEAAARAADASSSSPTIATCATGSGCAAPGRPARRGCSAGSERPAGVAVDRQPAAGAPAATPRRGPARATATSDDDPERRGWQPGRGATTKKGNPRKAPNGERDW